MKAIRTFLFVMFLFPNLVFAGSINYVSPESAIVGENPSIWISGNGTHFTQAEESIWLEKGSTQIYAYDYYAYGNSSLSAWFEIPNDAEAGLYSMKVYNSIDGTMTLDDCFTINRGLIIFVDPNSAQLGENIAVTIQCQNTSFEQESEVNICLEKGITQIYAYDYYPFDDSSLVAWFEIPNDAETGLYSMRVYANIGGTMTLNDCFGIGSGGGSSGSISAVNPNTAQQGKELVVAITGSNTHFLQVSQVANIWLSPGTPTIFPGRFYSVNDTLLIATFLIPSNAVPGLRDLHVYNNIDGTLTDPNSFTITPYNPTLTTVTPSASYQGQRLAVTITGQNTNFLRQGSPTTAFGQGSPTSWFGQQGSTTTTVVWFSQGSETIFSRDAGIAGDELLMADISIPEEANAGLWNVNVPDSCDGLLTLPNAFRIGRPGDLTCDGMVNFLDLRVLGDNWLEGANP